MHRLRRSDAQTIAEQAEEAEKDAYIKWLEATVRSLDEDFAHGQQENADLRERHKVEIETLQEQVNESKALQKQMKPFAISALLFDCDTSIKPDTSRRLTIPLSRTEIKLRMGQILQLIWHCSM